MTNKEIAKHFDFLAKLMELHDENPFRVRSYQNAYNAIRQTESPVFDMKFDELTTIKGIGKGISQDIIELQNTGEINYLNQLLDKTPEGVLDLMKIKGIGPKKVRSLWYDLSVESLGELEYAIKENRLSLLKGFGEKTQENILQQIEFLNSNKGNLLFFKADLLAQKLIKILKSSFPKSDFIATGELRRMMPVITKIEILTDLDSNSLNSIDHPEVLLDGNDFYFNNFKVSFIFCKPDEMASELFRTTGPDSFANKFQIEKCRHENDIFTANSLPPILPHLRDNSLINENPASFRYEDLVRQEDIKGVLHNHTLWSDGSDKILDMALYYRELGYEYMLLSDHSKSAFYANGVKEIDIRKYIDEVSQADSKIEGFRVFSGIESDILHDGSLDYDDKTLSLFDVVIASVHSGLRMDIDKATDRLLSAIANPYTKILGHATGRLLLSREGYPLDFEKIFEACANHKVAIELNSNPLRLDIDWQFIEKIQSMGIKISINPDAHSKFEVKYLDYGVIIAQKGGLLKENCLNAKSTVEFEAWMKEKN